MEDLEELFDEILFWYEEGAIKENLIEDFKNKLRALQVENDQLKSDVEFMSEEMNSYEN